MKHSDQCPKCNSTEIVRDAKTIDHFDYGVQHEMQVGVERNPTAWLFKGQQSCTVSAWICGECGYVEFYADDPATLEQAAREAERQ